MADPRARTLAANERSTTAEALIQQAEKALEAGNFTGEMFYKLMTHTLQKTEDEICKGEYFETSIVTHARMLDVNNQFCRSLTADPVAAITDRAQFGITRLNKEPEVLFELTYKEKSKKEVDDKVTKGGGLTVDQVKEVAAVYQYYYGIDVLDGKGIVRLVYQEKEKGQTRIFFNAAEFVSQAMRVMNGGDRPTPPRPRGKVYYPKTREQPNTARDAELDALISQYFLRDIVERISGGSILAVHPAAELLPRFPEFWDEYVRIGKKYVTTSPAATAATAQPALFNHNRAADAATAASQASSHQPQPPGGSSLNINR
jgi:hypothetical protein